MKLFAKFEAMRACVRLNLLSVNKLDTDCTAKSERSDERNKNECLKNFQFR